MIRLIKIQHHRSALSPIYPMELGISNEMIGNATIKPRTIRSTVRNFITPEKIVCTLISLPTTLFMTKTFIPNGGVTSPISRSLTTTTPNQIRSIPIPSTTGITNGSVSSIVPIESRNIPSTIYNNTMQNRTCQVSRPSPFTKLTKAPVTPVNDTNETKIFAPTAIKNKEAVWYVVSFIELRKSAQVSRLEITPKPTAKMKQTAAASVAVNTPP